MNILTLLAQDNFIMYNLKLARNLGVTEAILIGELARKYNYWYVNDRLTEDGYFYITQEDISLDTGLKINSIKNAFTHLSELGIVQISKKGGVDRSNYYRVNEEALINYL